MNKYKLKKDTPKWQIPIRVLIATICMPLIGAWYVLRDTILEGVPYGWETLCNLTSDYFHAMRDAWSIKYWRDWYGN